MEITNFVVQLVATVIAVFASGFGMLKYVISVFDKNNEEVGKQIGRLYQRLDEVSAVTNKKIDLNHEIIHQKFLLKEIAELEKNHHEKMIDMKFSNMVATVELNFTQVKALISEKRV